MREWVQTTQTLGYNPGSGGRKWTPGIIRYSRVPTSVLLEAANLANSGDLMNMRLHQFRQRFVAAVAQAIVKGK